MLILGDDFTSILMPYVKQYGPMIFDWVIEKAIDLIPDNLRKVTGLRKSPLQPYSIINEDFAPPRRESSYNYSSVNVKAFNTVLCPQMWSDRQPFRLSNPKVAISKGSETFMIPLTGTLATTPGSCQFWAHPFGAALGNNAIGTTVGPAFWTRNSNDYNPTAGTGTATTLSVGPLSSQVNAIAMFFVSGFMIQCSIVSSLMNLSGT